MSENEKKQKNKNFNFIIITIIFFLGLSVFQFFMYKNMRPRFHVVTRVIDFNIYEDLSVDFSTKVDIQVEREKDFSTLVSSFGTSDEEKLTMFQETLDNLEKQIPRDFVVLSYDSTVESEYPYIYVDETVKLKGFLIEKEDGLIEFSLPNQLLSGENENVKVTIHFPEQWKVVSVDPNPNYVEQNTIAYSYIGTRNYPTVQFAVE